MIYFKIDCNCLLFSATVHLSPLHCQSPYLLVFSLVFFSSSISLSCNSNISLFIFLIYLNPVSYSWTIFPFSGTIAKQNFHLFCESLNTDSSKPNLILLDYALFWYNCKTKFVTLFCELKNKRMFSSIIGINSGISLLFIVLGTFVAWICERAAIGVFW